MKKLFGLIVGLAAVISFTACDDDDDSAVDSTLKVVESNVTFGCGAEQGTITVESSSAITAKSSESWCTVSTSDKVVTVSVAESNEIESRNAVITISNADESVQVPVNQSGTIFWLKDASSAYLIQQDGSDEISIKSKISKDHTITVSDDWIHVEEADNTFNFTFDENATEDYRKGNITISDGTEEQSIYFGQFGTGDPLPGSYNCYYTESDEDYAFEGDEGCEIYATTTENYYYLTNFGSLGLTLPMYYTPASQELYVKNGTYLGAITAYSYYFYTMITYKYSSYNYVSYNTTSANYYIYFGLSCDDEANLVINWKDSGRLSSIYSQTGFQIRVFSSKSFTSTYNLGYWDWYSSVKLVKQD